ncbi:MAG: hypothetical protein ACRCZS_08755 [Chroococcidiopsis sp.]
MTPEEKLAHQSALARFTTTTQKAKRLCKKPTNLSATIIGYDAPTGKNIIQLPDGSISYGMSDTNGALAIGETLPLHSGTMRVDGLPNIKRIVTPKIPRSQKATTYTFWILFGDNILEWILEKDIATISLIASAANFPYPYNEFHGSNFGLAYKNKTQFYMPYYHRLALYDIASNSATTIYGEAEFDFETYTIQNTHATYTLPTGEFLFSVELRNDETFIYSIDRQGQLTNTPMNAVGYDLEAEAWSIAARDLNDIYMTLYNNVFALFNRETLQFTYIFESLFAGANSLYGSAPTGDPIDEITYCFLDTKTGDCYIVGVVIDSGVPGLEMEYVLNDIHYTGAAGVSDVGNPLKTFQADFPPGVVNPSDYISTSNGPGGLGSVYKVVNDSTVIIEASNDFFDNQNYHFPGELSTRGRHYRIVIWKVTPDLQLSQYYKFPTIDNRTTADGYRLLYNGPSRGALIDPKTKDIYIYGERRNIIENGIFKNNRAGFNQGNLVKITPAKKLVPIKNKFASTVSSDDIELIINNWYADQAQLETGF